MYDSRGIRPDIAHTIKALYGDNWQKKINLRAFKAIPFDKAFLRRYDQLVQEYLSATFEPFIAKLINDIKQIAVVRQDDAGVETEAERTASKLEFMNIEPNIDVGNGFLAQIDAFENHAEEVLITFSVIIKEIGKDMLEQNNSIFAEQLSSAFGFTPDFARDTVYKHLNSWIAENVSLIQNVDNIAKTQLKSIISQNFRNGGRSTNMIDSLQKVTGFKEYRLRLIARDQTAKLHGQIAKMQQTSIGISKYTWIGAADERERPTHVALNNSERRWGDGLEPGFEFQCRCVAAPKIDFDSILRSFEKEFY